MQGLIASAARSLVPVIAAVLVITTLGPLGEASAATPMTLNWTSNDRHAIWNDGSDSMKLKVKATGPVKKVIIDDGYSLPGGLQAGSEEGRIRLYDDGTHGDSTAGDSVFTRSGISAKAPWDWGMGIFVELHSTSGAVKKWDWPVMGIIVLDRKHRVPIAKLDSGMRHTSRVANLKVGTDVYDPKVVYGQRRRPNLGKVARRFYQRFPDRFDFLTIWNQQDVPPGFFHQPVQNTVKGIGMNRFDASGAYGSKGRLKGINFLGKSGEYALIHETVHQWAAFLDGLGLSRDGHWWAVDVQGYLYGLGFKWVAKGKYKITWAPGNMSLNHRLSWLEMYLAGFAMKREVPKVTRLVGVDPRYVQKGQIVRPKSVVRKSIDQIIGKYGKRVPNYGKSRKHYRMASVLVTVGRFATPAEMAAYHLTMEKFGGTGGGDWEHPTTSYPSWNWVTRGRSTMNTKLGSPK